MKKSTIVLFILFIAAFSSCKTEKKETSLTIPFEKYTLPNGLTVVLNIDKSDPIAALAVYYHVGSSREVEGKTGFAHLFEHMMFQKSENVGEDQPTTMRLSRKMLSKWQCGWRPTEWAF